MTRAFNLSLTEAEVVRHCNDRQIAISALEALPNGGMRLVCSSGDGAAKIRAKLARHIMKGEVRRELFRPRRPLW